MFRLYIYIIAIFTCMDLHAQLMPFRNYGIKDGLSDNNVQAVIRDDRGLLWVGTDFSVYWFDGKKFYQPQIKTNIGQLYVNNFYKDNNGVIWILTFFNGIYKFRDGQFTNYLPDTLLKNATANSTSDMVQVSPGKYIVISDDRPYLFDGRNFTLFDSTNSMLSSKTNCATLTRDGTVLISSDFGVFEYKSENGKFRLTGHYLEGRATSKIVQAAGRLWIMTTNELLSFDNNVQRPLATVPVSYLTGKPIKDLITDKNGKIWVLADTVYKIDNKTITAYTPANGLPAYIRRIYADPDGLIWFANRKGVCMLGDEYYEFTPLKDNEKETAVASLNTDTEGNLWIGTAGGLVIKNNRGYTFYPTVFGDTIGYISCLHKNANGILLAATDAGLLSVDGNSIKKESEIPAAVIAEDEAGRTWLGDVDGNIWIYSGQVLSKVKTDHSTHEMIVSLYIQKENVWVGYRGLGIRKFGLRNDTLTLIKDFSSAAGLNDLRIRSSAVDCKGHILFGTRTNGLFIFSLTTDSLIAHITTQNGLNANWIKSILCDDDGKLYLATNNGINILSGEYRNPSIKQLKIENENINRETNYITKTGNVFYIGTNEGVLKWMPGNMLKDSTPPPVYFTRIGIQGLENFSVAPYIRDAGAIKLPYEQHIISFEFAGIALKNPENVRYQYMLEGQNKEWSPLTEYNYVSYNLKPGNYTFKVIARNADGTVSRNPAVFHFIIQPPFWSSWWFISSVILLLVLLVYTAYRYKLDQLLALEQLRNQISTDLHDDIGSTLSSISILSDMAMKEPSQPYAVGMMKGIKENSTFLLEKMDDIVWSINPKNDTLENLLVRMQRFAAVLLEAKNIDYSIDIAPTIRNVKLSMSYRQHIYLILKETINNLAKYSNATKADIRVVYHNNILGITIQDNGIGFDTTVRQFGNGIINMRQRAKLMNTTISIDSEPGSGTKISFNIKIK